MPRTIALVVSVGAGAAAIAGLSALLRSDGAFPGYGHGVASGAARFLARTLVLPGGATGGVLSASSPRGRRSRRGTAGGEQASEAVPELIVFDLDGTLWWPEMYMLDRCPSVPVHGSLGDRIGNGVVGLSVPPKGPAVRLFPGALRVLQTIRSDPRFRSVQLAAASTSEEPEYSYACLDHLEVAPGVSMRSMFDYTVIGRTEWLSKYKSRHFQLIHEQSGVPYDRMLFFDDCNWQDHVSDMYKTFGVIGQKTPHGLTVEEFEMGLEKYRKAVSAK